MILDHIPRYLFVVDNRLEREFKYFYLPPGDYHIVIEASIHLRFFKCLSAQIAEKKFKTKFFFHEKKSRKTFLFP